MSFTPQPVPETPHARTTLNANGRIVIPVEIRKAMGVEAGETLLMEIEDGVLRVETYPSRIRRIQQSLAKYIKPGVLASDELIAERREEARREEEEYRRDRDVASGNRKRAANG